MVDVRKIIIIFVIAILFSVFVFSSIDAVYPRPDWDDVCGSRTMPLKHSADTCEDIEVPQEAYNSCKGYIEFTYGANGCANGYECNTCQITYNEKRDVYNQYLFYISAVLALAAIFIGLYLPAQNNPLHEWIGTGFMLGGAFTLFFGTAQSFGSLGRFVRPLIMLGELILVIFIAYKKVGNLRSDKKK